MWMLPHWPVEQLSPGNTYVTGFLGEGDGSGKVLEYLKNHEWKIPICVKKHKSTDPRSLTK